MNLLIKEYEPCDEDLRDALYLGFRQGGHRAVDIAVDIDVGVENVSFEEAHRALRELAPLIKVLRARIAKEGIVQR
mgnify:FL=1